MELGSLALDDGQIPIFRYASFLIEATISDLGTIEDVFVVRPFLPALTKALTEAVLASKFQPAMREGRPAPSRVQVAYTLYVAELGDGTREPTDHMPPDAEIERRAGLHLAEAARAFIESADEFTVFEVCRPSDPNSRRRMEDCGTRQIWFDTCGGKYGANYDFINGVPLAKDQIFRLKDILVAQSPYWSVSRKNGEENSDLRFAGTRVGYDYGISITKGDEELFILFAFDRAGQIVVRSRTECFGQGHPYRRSVDLFCELVGAQLGQHCVGDEW